MGLCNNYNSAAIMFEEAKDFESAVAIIEELRAKCRYQTEHIIKWKKAYALQIQQHYRYQKQKTDQMNALTSQLLLLESRLKRKQKQIASIISQRELTIHRQQKIIETLSARLVEHGLETIDPVYTDLDSLNDSDSAVVLEDIDSDCYNSGSLISRRKGSCGGSTGSDGVTIVRSISDAIDSNLNKYSRSMRSNCFLRRPEVLETVYSVEEDPEPNNQGQNQSGTGSVDVAEKRDKFRNRSEKVIVNSLEGQLDGTSNKNGETGNNSDNKSENKTSCANTNNGSNNKYINTSLSSQLPIQSTATFSPPINTSMYYIYHQNELMNGGSSKSSSHIYNYYDNSNDSKQTTVTNFNRVMLNHRSVTKPKDVKYKRINKAKSKSLEELRGRLKHWVEKGGSTASLHTDHPAAAAVAAVANTTLMGGLNGSPIQQTAQSYA